MNAHHVKTIAVIGSIILAYQANRATERQLEANIQKSKELGERLAYLHVDLRDSMKQFDKYEVQAERKTYESEFDYRLSRIGMKNNKPRF